MTQNPDATPSYSSRETSESFAYLISELSTNLINAAPEEAEVHIEKALAALGCNDRKDRCYVFLFDDSYKQMSNTHEWVNRGITAHKEELQNVPLEAMPWFFASMRADGQVVVPSSQNLPDVAGGFKDELLRESIQSMMAVGMYLEGRLIGFVGCDLVQRACDWNEQDVRQMQLVADMITNTIARHRTEAKLHELQAELRSANERLAQLANEDSLTGLINRRGLDLALATELRRMQRKQEQLSVLMVDIDHFKELNDRQGHLAGDVALQCVATELSRAFKRSGEVVARYGGDEFLILSPSMNAEEAEQRAAALLGSVRSCTKASEITVSIGIISFIPGIDTTPEEAIRRVDKAVYQAKNNGRNCFVRRSYE
ncbi:sensor domain-containing diguanylate cyclase [Pseudidiomarina terrestris]|uniref:sensor domain-containing diguanylate cyclase n=1 Tax=Pseudidiomarina terrestris TaxID=2820060 RepID=UPI00265387C3|nr:MULTISPECIES: sensor domain-containing diguanylate cyclase [unclassified Pseudidiomarina]MDN7127885.1 sensor domain-containing diguanylate cyclase [Pseudidiomarina sp. 1APR75-33.1]MDN7134745.1 sensor domain-containing diguanylate cyclase [Pseudidiomarina sp. 1ASP75-5]MDN7137423.1 sensor domain-containing diguanylate cyclase [Pseudidiomarina sp. 1ASP75-14]MEA3587467.1 sensor domain-containing diguanylate cyclase [Pseudidiomarina sp. 1APP75-27a]